MIFSSSTPAFPAWRDALSAAYRRNEDDVVNELIAEATLPAEVRRRIAAHAAELVRVVRANRAKQGGIDAFMSEYDLSTQEGLVLMCLAEALLRVPDAETADRLIRDKLTGTDWERHLGHSRSIFVNASTIGLMLTGRILGPADIPEDAPTGVLRRLTARLGEPVIRQALRQAMGIMGRQFVLGRTIEEAQNRAAASERKGYRYSYDMLGEAARTEEDAQRYLRAYETAIHAIGKASAGKGVIDGPGISVKLSALHPRYEPGKRDKMLDVLVGRTLDLARLAKSYDIGFCIDAEESERLELSLEIIERVYSDPSLDGWEGFGLAVQAYQKRAREVIDALAGMVDRVGRRMNVRLVKGAYWDTEIKRAQELGMSDYPVFTRKTATDVSYLACAHRLFEHGGRFYPQFATHNAHTVAAVLEMSEGRPFEYQRLHGMGEELYDEIVPADKLGIPCRIYAPVGGHAELLSYLVRRLLENGANTSFVNRLVDDRTPIDTIVADPVERLSAHAVKRHPHIPLPRDIYDPQRLNARGIDLTDSRTLEDLDRAMERHAAVRHTAAPIVGGTERPRDEAVPVRDPADRQRLVGVVTEARPEDVEDALALAETAYPGWNATPPEQRAAIFEDVANRLERHMPELMAICVREAGKTLPDAVAEVREAVDFLRYYANQVRTRMTESLTLPDALGQAAQVGLEGRGVFVCISPWNFPVAIFTGQVTAALGAGNAVIAKPAEQTSLVAAAVVRLFHEAGVPGDVLHLLPGRGETVGAQLIGDRRVAGVAFTGSVEVARIISRTLAERTGRAVPLIAETGGMNAMIVDSSALPEQVIRDAVLSGFGSAGQRCSALRVLYVQEDVADSVITMLKGAMAELEIGDPGRVATDVGPVIDEEARETLEAHAARMDREAKPLYTCTLPETCRDGTFFAPRAYEIEGIHVLDREVFGPVVHVVRYPAGALDKVIKAIDSTGYGLTMGIHTRIDAKARAIQTASRVGNTYVNRNMIGAVVGVQPFGGENLSGTGPKAGGPHYVPRFARTTATPADDADATLAAARRSTEMEAAKLFPADLPYAPAASKAEAVARALEAARPAFRTWKRRPAEERAALLQRFADAVARERVVLAGLLMRDGGRDAATAAGEILAAQRYLAFLAERVRATMAAPTPLPGPTGEHNELQLHPRGVVLAGASGEGSFALAAAQVGAALGAGNAVVAVADTALAAILDRLAAARDGADAPDGILSLAFGPSDMVASAVRNPHVDAVAVNGAAGLVSAVVRAAADRPGPLLTVIEEPFGPAFIERFVIERTLTIDLTAAGGNASLLTLNEDTPADAAA